MAPIFHPSTSISHPLLLLRYGHYQLISDPTPQSSRTERAHRFTHLRTRFSSRRRFVTEPATASAKVWSSPQVRLLPRPHCYRSWRPLVPRPRCQGGGKTSCGFVWFNERPDMLGWYGRDDSVRRPPAV